MDKIVYKDDGGYIKVKKHEEFYYSERKGIDSCAFILMKDANTYGLVKERMHSLDDRFPKEEQPVLNVSAFCGSQDVLSETEYKKLSEKERINLFKKIVKKECLEESGYYIKNITEHIQFMGKIFVSTQMNQFCYLYLVTIDEDTKNIGQKPQEKDEELYQKIQWINMQDIRFMQDIECGKTKSILFNMINKW